MAGHLSDVADLYLVVLRERRVRALVGQDAAEVGCWVPFPSGSALIQHLLDRLPADECRHACGYAAVASAWFSRTLLLAVNTASGLSSRSTLMETGRTSGASLGILSKGASTATF